MKISYTTPACPVAGDGVATCSYTGALQTYTVPSGLTDVLIAAAGAVARATPPIGSSVVGARSLRRRLVSAGDVRR